jgi:hypothetical protein
MDSFFASRADDAMPEEQLSIKSSHRGGAVEVMAPRLRPGGIVALWEPVRQDAGGTIHQFGSLLDLFFGIFSEAGSWSAVEVAEWFRDAGLEAKVLRSPRMMPALALHIGRKHGECSA